MTYDIADISSHVRVMPMRAVAVRDSSLDLDVAFDHVEEESSWSLEPIEQPNSRGGDSIVAFRVLIEAYVMYNRFEDMRPDLEAMTYNRPQDIDLDLDALDGQVAGAYIAVRLDGSSNIAVRDWHLSWRIASVQFRPRLSIRVKGIASRDIIKLTGASSLFKQISGF